MITYIKIDGFKSFQNFEMIFTPLTVIAGTNASGKSNLFDALHLLSRLAETDLKTAFSEQRGNPDELFTQYGNNTYSSKMSFVVEMLLDRTIKDNWGGEAQLNNTRLRYELSIERKKGEYGFQSLNISHEQLEKIKPADDTWSSGLLETNEKLWKTVRSGGSKEPFIKTEAHGSAVAIKIRQDGKQGGKATPANAASQTVLGGINSVDFPHAFAAKEEMRKWKFLQLNPEDLREPTRQDSGMKDEITQSGKNLASALFRIMKQDPYSIKEISRKLNTFLPDFTEVNVYDDRANKQYIIKLKDNEGQEFSSRVLSEGTLRLLALCILEYDENHTGLICFEEPENGIHPFRIRAMAELLKELSADFTREDALLRQVIINTHSPVLLNVLINWQGDQNLSIWLSKQNTLVDGRNGKLKLKITRVERVARTSEKATQISMFPVSNEQERKLTIHEIIKYLETSGTKDAIEIIQS